MNSSDESKRMGIAFGLIVRRSSIIASMTAIVRHYVDEGFVLASDGRLLDSETMEKASDTAQKIFQIGQSPVAYSMTGAHAVGIEGGQPFDFREEFRRALPISAIESAASLSGYVREACGIVYEALRDAGASRKVAFPAVVFGPPGTIIHVFFDGYVRGEPEMVTARFYQQNGVPGYPEIISSPLGRESHGSEIVERHAGDPAFSKYKHGLRISGTRYSGRIIEAIRVAHNYIAACSGPEALALDPDICRGIGGRIHIATITPKMGFRWVVGLGPIFLPPPSGRLCGPGALLRTEDFCSSDAVRQPTDQPDRSRPDR